MGDAIAMKTLWNRQNLIQKFQSHRDEPTAIPMAAYMRNQFPFLGIKTPMRKALLKEQLSECQLPEANCLKEEVWALYCLPEREYQYAAIALLDKMKIHLSLDDLPFLRQLVESKSWWDSVDSIAPRIVGHVVLQQRNAGTRIMFEWASAANMWTNRAAILHQLKFKQHTDKTVLSRIILQHAGSSEFFIQKSIGWALREYAKTDPGWVRDFVEASELKPLSKREALKNINK